MQVQPLWAAIGLSLVSFPLSYMLNSLSSLESPLLVALIGFGVLLALFAVVYLPNRSEDPLFYVCMVFSFTSIIDIIIALEEDGYISGFMEFYMREGEVYLTTTYGIMICYWDGTVHYALYLLMIAAMAQRKDYRTLVLYWVGSLGMSLLVFLTGNVIGKWFHDMQFLLKSFFPSTLFCKYSPQFSWEYERLFTGKYGSEIKPAAFLNAPYLLILIWACGRIIQQPKTSTLMAADKVSQEQSKCLLQRPVDLGLVVFLHFAVAFTLFRGLVVLDCPADACFDYIYQQEPYLRDPVAYPKVQMLIYLFYCLPYFCLCIYGLISPGCTWMPDWALIFAGATAQAQFCHIGSSLHLRTPYPYRTPEGAWWSFVLSNVAFAIGPQLLAYRCLRNPGFFSPVVSPDEGKKNQ